MTIVSQRRASFVLGLALALGVGCHSTNAPQLVAIGGAMLIHDDAVAKILSERGVPRVHMEFGNSVRVHVPIEWADFSDQTLILQSVTEDWFYTSEWNAPERFYLVDGMTPTVAARIMRESGIPFCISKDEDGDMRIVDVMGKHKARARQLLADHVKAMRN